MAVVEDDGSGFEPSVRGDGLGLVGMRRARWPRRREAPDRSGSRSRDDGACGGTAAVSIRVLVVDDHAVVRTGLRRVLDAEPDIETVSEAPTADRRSLRSPGAQAGRGADGRHDARQERDRGGCPTCCRRCPTTKVLVLSMHDDPRYVREAFEAGASGYVLKEAADTEVVDAVRTVAAGDATCIPLSAPGSSRPTSRNGSARRQTRSPTGSARCCDYWRSVTRTRRSRRCSTSPSVRRRHTGHTSCRSSGSRAVRSSSATRSTRV